MTHEMAIMKHVSFGLRDTNHAAIWFDVSMLGCGSLLSIPRNDVIKFMEENDISDLRNLEGKPCVVNRDGGMVTFVRLIK